MHLICYFALTQVMNGQQITPGPVTDDLLLNGLNLEGDGVLNMYNAKYDIPKSEANFTDSRNVVHPAWAEPFFAQEYSSFDEAFGLEEGELNDQ